MRRNDDWGAQYSFVPRNTLLEPNNVIPSWEFGDEENKEVSATLRRIRQKYDDIHKTVLAKERELEIKKVGDTPTIMTFTDPELWFCLCSVSLSKPKVMRRQSRITPAARRTD